jgi:hypothetical protein
MKSTFKPSVFGLASSPIHASRIVNHLVNAGFSRDGISVLQPEHSGRCDVVDDHPDAISDGRMMEVDMGLPDNWPASTGMFPNSGFDQFKAGEPIRGVLCGATVASASPGAAKNNRHRIAERQLLICLQANEWRVAEAARKIFQALGASNVTLGGEKASHLLAQSFQRFEAGFELQPVS